MLLNYKDIINVHGIPADRALEPLTKENVPVVLAHEFQILPLNESPYAAVRMNAPSLLLSTRRELLRGVWSVQTIAKKY
jgi:hypothetical protein